MSTGVSWTRRYLEMRGLRKWLRMSASSRPAVQVHSGSVQPPRRASTPKPSSVNAFGSLGGQHAHTPRAYAKAPMHARPGMQITDSAFCKKRAAARGCMGAMLVEQGGAADEGGGDSPSSSAFLQLVGVLRRGRCGRAAAATGRGGQTGGTRGRLRLLVKSCRRPESNAPTRPLLAALHLSRFGGVCLPSTSLGICRG